jgi:hypothetical protein
MKGSLIILSFLGVLITNFFLKTKKGDSNKRKCPWGVPKIGEFLKSGLL